jgi:hypothetical protein
MTVMTVKGKAEEIYKLIQHATIDEVTDFWRELDTIDYHFSLEVCRELIRMIQNQER